MSVRPACLQRLALCLAVSAGTRLPAAETRVIEAAPRHLGVAGLPEWDHFAAATPHGPQLELSFECAETNAVAHALLIRQRDVKTTWNTTLNGQKIGTLETLHQPLVRALEIPPGLIRAGENHLLIARPPSPTLDDIVVSEITLVSVPREAFLADASLILDIHETETRAPLACRLTIVDARGALAPLHAAPGQKLAARTGVVYTGDGRARLGLPPGDYMIYASRGFEYSVATETVSLRAGETRSLTFALRREVPTPGFVACDSHIHTLTHSKHGDATIDERMLTIAGEGIELAIATDHNHAADYSAASARMDTPTQFRAVTGNEVTTAVGHFNAFPVAADGALPDSTKRDWPELLQHIRRVTGARVITLNHPRDIHENFTPFAPEHFDAATGQLHLATPAQFACDAIEVVTSAALRSDPLELYRDWFALLNRGYRVAAIGASDTHHVSAYILGQARTYVAVRRDDPATLDLEEVWGSYRHGRLLVSLGLLATLTVDDRFTVGDHVRVSAETVNVSVTVLGPSWVTADRVELYANGERIRDARIEPSARVEKARVTWALPRPARDTFLVAIASGPGVRAPFWEIPPPYQATSKTLTPRVLGSTNPIWLDADGDGKFTPRSTPP